MIDLSRLVTLSRCLGPGGHPGSTVLFRKAEAPGHRDSVTKGVAPSAWVGPGGGGACPSTACSPKSLRGCEQGHLPQVENRPGWEGHPAEGSSSRQDRRKVVSPTLQPPSLSMDRIPPHSRMPSLSEGPQPCTGNRLLGGPSKLLPPCLRAALPVAAPDQRCPPVFIGVPPAGTQSLHAVDHVFTGSVIRPHPGSQWPWTGMCEPVGR